MTAPALDGDDLGALISDAFEKALPDPSVLVEPAQVYAEQLTQSALDKLTPLTTLVRDSVEGVSEARLSLQEQSEVIRSSMSGLSEELQQSLSDLQPLLEKLSSRSQQVRTEVENEWISFQAMAELRRSLDALNTPILNGCRLRVVLLGLADAETRLMGRRRRRGQEPGINLFSFLNIMTATIGVQTLLIVIFTPADQTGCSVHPIAARRWRGQGLTANTILQWGGQLELIGAGERLSVNLGSPVLERFLDRIAQSRSQQYLVIGVRLARSLISRRFVPRQKHGD